MCLIYFLVSWEFGAVFYWTFAALGFDDHLHLDKRTKWMDTIAPTGMVLRSQPEWISVHVFVGCISASEFYVFGQGLCRYHSAQCCSPVGVSHSPWMFELLTMDPGKNPAATPLCVLVLRMERDENVCWHASGCLGCGIRPYTVRIRIVWSGYGASFWELCVVERSEADVFCVGTASSMAAT